MQHRTNRRRIRVAKQRRRELSPLLRSLNESMEDIWAIKMAEQIREQEDKLYLETVLKEDDYFNYLLE